MGFVGQDRWFKIDVFKTITVLGVLGFGLDYRQMNLYFELKISLPRSDYIYYYYNNNNPVSFEWKGCSNTTTNSDEAKTL